MDLMKSLPEWAKSDVADRIESFNQTKEAGDIDESETFTIADAIREIAQDVDTSDFGYTDQHRRDMNEYLLGIGVMRAVSDDEYANACVWTSSGRSRKSAVYPKLKSGQRVTFESWDPLTKAGAR